MVALGLQAPKSDIDRARLGTRFLVYPQPPFIAGYELPETVWLSLPPGELGPGPASRRIYVVDPRSSKEPYGFPFLPPFSGAMHPPAAPGGDGHFDHFATDTREFLAAHVFVCTHRILDICEGFAGREIPWFFSPSYDRLEIVPRIEWNNAHSGFGFLEMGDDDVREDPFPYALNFDAIAHETGHLVLLGAIGAPSPGRTSLEFLAYHEAIADFISLLGLLHFDSALDKILRRTRGNLMIVNELDRFAETGDERQIRVMSHSLKLSDVGNEVHDHSKPFAGALFDTLLEIFQGLLFERGLSRLDQAEMEELRLEMTTEEIERELAVSPTDYEFKHLAVKSALAEARDIIGEALVRSWSTLDADDLSFEDAAEALLVAVDTGRGGRFGGRVEGNFRWRKIL